MQATYTPETDAKLRQWAAEGVPVTEQARRLGVTRHRVSGWRRRLGLNAPLEPITPEQHAKILEWAADGWPLKEVAETSGLSIHRLRREYPQLSWGAAAQGRQGSLVRTAVRQNPRIMRGL